jgi:hypothetical protein
MEAARKNPDEESSKGSDLKGSGKFQRNSLCVFSEENAGNKAFWTRAAESTQCPQWILSTPSH